MCHFAVSEFIKSPSWVCSRWNFCPMFVDDNFPSSTAICIWLHLSSTISSLLELDTILDNLRRNSESCLAVTQGQCPPVQGPVCSFFHVLHCFHLYKLEWRQENQGRSILHRQGSIGLNDNTMYKAQENLVLVLKIYAPSWAAPMQWLQSSSNLLDTT